jgi:hypothetical protein
MNSSAIDTVPHQVGSSQFVRSTCIVFPIRERYNEMASGLVENDCRIQFYYSIAI